MLVTDADKSLRQAGELKRATGMAANEGDLDRPVPALKQDSAVSAARRANAHAVSWMAAWNTRDLDAIMTLYSPTVRFNAQTVVTRWGKPDGWLRGRTQLREHFARGLTLAPDLHFTSHRPDRQPRRLSPCGTAATVGTPVSEDGRPRQRWPRPASARLLRRRTAGLGLMVTPSDAPEGAEMPTSLVSPTLTACADNVHVLNLGDAARTASIHSGFRSVWTIWTLSNRTDDPSALVTTGTGKFSPTAWTFAGLLARPTIADASVHDVQLLLARL